MSTVEKKQPWSDVPNESLDSKYEKCRNITEEIYKRINITFQIKQLEAGQSDVSQNSDIIDSNELSNETDLFACDKSDISSSEAEKPPTDCIKFININNNEEKKKPVCKRPKKRLRKRVKKRPNRRASDTEGSSDEAPLSRIVDIDSRCLKRDASPETCMGVPALIVLTADLKSKAQDKKTTKKESTPAKVPIVKIKPIESIDKIIDKEQPSVIKDKSVNDKKSMTSEKKSMVNDKMAAVDKERKAEKEKGDDVKSCSLCSLTFRGERGLRRHLSMTHQSYQKERN